MQTTCMAAELHANHLHGSGAWLPLFLDLTQIYDIHGMATYGKDTVVTEALRETKRLHGVRRQTLYLHGTVQCFREAPLEDHRHRGRSGHLMHENSVWGDIYADAVWSVGSG